MTNSGVSTKQKAAIRALLTGASYAAAAKAAGVHENTVGQWMREPAFLGALQQAEGEAMQVITRSLVSLAEKAAGVLKSILDDTQARNSSKVRAADVVLGRLLEIKRMSEFEDRLRRIEEALNEQNEQPG